MGGSTSNFCLCRHHRDQVFFCMTAENSEICRMFLLLVHAGMHASYSDCPYSSHNIELWRKSSRCPEKAKRKVFICFLIAEIAFLVCSTFKICPHTDSLVNQGRKLHLNLICLTKKANTSKGSRKKWGNVFLHAEKNLMGHGTYMLLPDFFLLLWYCNLWSACYCSGNENSKQIFISMLSIQITVIWVTIDF